MARKKKDISSTKASGGEMAVDVVDNEPELTPPTKEEKTQEDVKKSMENKDQSIRIEDTEQAMAAADKRISEKVDNFATANSQPQTVKAEDGVEVDIANTLDVSSPSPNVKPVSETAMQAAPATSFVKIPIAYEAMRRNKWESGLEAFFTPQEYYGYQLTKFGSVGSIDTRSQREDSFHNLIVEVMMKHRGIPYDVERTKSFVEGFKHTDFSSCGFDLLGFYNSLQKPEDQVAVVGVLKSLSDISMKNRMRGSMVVLPTVKKNLYEALAKLEEEREIPFAELQAYVLSVKNSFESMVRDKTYFLEEFARAPAPPSPTITQQFIQPNPQLVARFADYMRSYISNGFSINMFDDTITVDSLMLKMGFKVGVMDSVKRFMSTMSTSNAKSMVQHLIMKRACGRYLDLRVDVDMYSYSFNTALMGICLRLFPKHLISPISRIILNNWMWYHVIGPLVLDQNKLSTQQWDFEKAINGTVDYLDLNFKTFGRIPREVFDFFHPDTGYLDAGQYAPIAVPSSSSRWERTQSGILHWPYAGKLLPSPSTPLSIMAKLSAFARYYPSGRNPRLGGSTLHGTTMANVLTYLAGQTKAVAMMYYFLDEVSRTMMPGMPIDPQTMQNADDKHIGISPTILHNMAPFSMLTLADPTTMTTFPLTKRWEAVSHGMSINGMFEIFIEFYRFFFHRYDDKTRTHANLIQSFRALIDAVVPTSAISYVFDEWLKPPLKQDLVIPKLDVTRKIWFRMLTVAKAFVADNYQYFGLAKEMYLCPFNSTEHVVDVGALGREYVPDRSDVVKVTREHFLDLVVTGKLHDFYAEAMHNRKVIEIEGWFTYESSIVVDTPSLMPSDVVKVQIGSANAYAVDTLKYYWTLQDQEWKIDNRPQPFMPQPMVAIPRPKTLSFMTPSEIFGMVSHIESRKDVWTFHDFSSFYAVTRDEDVSGRSVPFEN